MASDRLANVLPATLMLGLKIFRLNDCIELMAMDILCAQDVYKKLFWLVNWTK